MPNKIYGFAGLNFRFLADEEIITTPRFADFLKTEAESYTDVRIIRGKLPEKIGDKTQIDGRRAFYKHDGKEHLFSAYFEQRACGYLDFSCRETCDCGYNLYIDFEGGLTDLMLFEALYIPEILAREGILILHASFVIYNGEAIVFAGDKQVGKTTQAQLWEKYENAEIINGDRTALKISDGRLYAVGIPFCGSSEISADKSAPVRATVFPSIAEKTQIVRRSGIGIFTDILKLLTYCRQAERETALASDIAEFITSRTDVYSMPCTPDEETVNALKNILF